MLKYSEMAELLDKARDCRFNGNVDGAIEYLEKIVAEGYNSLVPYAELMLIYKKT